MLYLLERVENMQIFARENLVFFAFPSIKYANAMHNAASSLRSHTHHVMHKHKHTPGTSMQPKTSAWAAACPSTHDKQGCVGRKSIRLDSQTVHARTAPHHCFPSVGFNGSSC